MSDPATAPAMAFSDIAIRLAAAVLLAALVGIERERRHHPAGLRTMILVSLGCAAFTILGIHVAADTQGSPGDLSRILQGMIGGVGFLGAGAIIHSQQGTHGLTTAAAVWCIAVVGAACGLGHLALAALLAVLVVTVLFALRPFEERLFHNDPPAKPPTHPAP